MDVSITRTGDSLEDALDDLNQAFTKAQRATGKRMAAAGRAAILDEALKRRGTLSFSGMNVKRLGASARIRPTPTSVTVLLTAKPAGPWSIVEYGAKAHPIYPKRGRVGKGGRPAALQLFDGSDFFAANVAHPGSPPFHVWTAATAGGADSKIELAVRDVFDTALDEVA